jgi:diguanylate cyclase (GGDEF)-like protein/PAS domain S-box-containing protein
MDDSARHPGITMVGKRFRSLQDPETLRQLVSNLQEGIYITNDRGEILDANPACLEIFGVASLDELRRYSAQDLYAEPAQRLREAEVLARDGMLREFEIQIRRPDGEERTVLDTSYAVCDPATDEVLYHGILVDITSRKQLENRLHELSLRDPLTGCYNRRYLTQLEQQTEYANSCWGAIVVDIDNFKSYNDDHGHQAGDEILMHLTRFLLRNARAGDAVVRMGGDEFLLLLFGGQVHSCTEVARRLEQAAAGSDLVPFSLGWAERRENERLEQMIDRADRKLLHVRIRERRHQQRRASRR